MRDMLVADEGYVMVALDFSGQELRLAAEDSQDPMMLACYIGDSLKDLHSITGHKVATMMGHPDWSYEYFSKLIEEGSKAAKDFRSTGKKINFSAQYGCRAAKLAGELFVDEKTGQIFLDARENAYPTLIQRVKDIHKEARAKKYSTTFLGRRRHLDGYAHYGSREKFNHLAADRLSYSMKIQGSAGEQTKQVMGEFEKRGICDGERVKPIVPIHDELVVQVRLDVVEEMIPLMVDLMCRRYANMSVPPETEPEVGFSLGSLKKWKGTMEATFA